jgi:hypothetical protein
LSDGELGEMDLSYTDLSGARMDGADLSNADLRYAILIGTDLRYADLTGTRLEGANLSDALLSYSTGLDWAICGWTDHDMLGGALIGALIGDAARYFYIEMSGTEEWLRERIAESNDERSRLVALEFVSARLAEMWGRR